MLNLHSLKLSYKEKKLCKYEHSVLGLLGGSGVFFQFPWILPGIASVLWLFLLPVHTFLAMEGGDSEFAKLTLPALKAFLKACSHSVCGNQQKLVAHAIGC